MPTDTQHADPRPGKDDTPVPLDQTLYVLTESEVPPPPRPDGRGYGRKSLDDLAKERGKTPPGKARNA